MGNLGVILGILFLAVELQQSNRIAIGTAEAELRERYIELGNLEIENPNMAQAVLALREKDTELTPIQDLLLRRYARNHATFFMSVESAYDGGLITEDSLNSWLNVAGNTVNSEQGLAPYLSRIFRVREDEDLADNIMLSHILDSIDKL